MVFPLKALPETDLFTLTYEIHPWDEGLHVCVELRGDYSSVDFAGSSTSELWRGTCVELFYKENESRSYTELNISPDGRNTVMEFSEYRKVRVSSSDILQTNVSVQKTEGVATIEILIKGFFVDNKSIALAVITANSEGTRRFWGIDHWGLTPDFHRSENFFMLKNS